MKLDLPESTTAIAEDYIIARLKNKSFQTSDYRNQLTAMGKNTDQINELLTKMYDEYEKEDFQQKQEPNPRLLIVSGSILLSTCALITILSLFGLLFGGYGYVLMIGGIATGLVTILKGFDQLKMRKHRQQIRSLRWELYD